jgi:mono/diheme cytochrome c family protein
MTSYSSTVTARAWALVSLVSLGSAAAPGLAPAWAEPTDPVEAVPRAASPDPARAQAAFVDVARVLQSPRCQNCHPAGDRPLRGDRGEPHPQAVRRRLSTLGASCATCHQDHNAPGVGAPPGAPHWGLPPEATPMIFEGRSLAALCTQLKDPVAAGGRSLDALVHHVTHDALVLWGWAPGGERKPPPLTHAAFVEAIRTWVAHGAACPDERTNP